MQWSLQQMSFIYYYYHTWGIIKSHIRVHHVQGESQSSPSPPSLPSERHARYI